MPRHSRLFLPGATYHVYCRVARGEFVFYEDFEAIKFIEVLRKVSDLDGRTVLAWCLMAITTTWSSRLETSICGVRWPGFKAVWPAATTGAIVISAGFGRTATGRA